MHGVQCGEFVCGYWGFFLYYKSKANLELSVFEKRRNPKTRRMTSESKEESLGHYILIGRIYGSIDIVDDKNGIRNYQ